MKTWTVKVEICGIEGKTAEEAKRSFWEIVDDTDYKVEAKAIEEK